MPDTNDITTVRTADTPAAPPIDPFMDDTPIVATCDLANPESCESCT